MSRQPGAESIYRFADLFRQRCLLEGRSLLWPDQPAWTIENLNALYDAFIGHPDEGTRDFFQKWQDQLADQSDDVVRIAADLMVIYMLFPDVGSIGPAAKLRAVEQIVSWRADTLHLSDDALAMLKAAFARGIGNVGTYYQTKRPWELQFLLEFSRDVISRGVDPADPAACKQLADDVRARMGKRVQSRHSLLHLLFPDHFERTSSESQKEKIAQGFPAEAGGAIDLDDRLFAIRTTLAARYQRPDIDFYQDDIRALWDHPAIDIGPSNDDASIWLFQANPNIWSLSDALRSAAIGDEETWSVSRYRNRMKVGDRVLLWQSGPDAGLYAIGELTGEPFERETAEFWPDRDERPATEWAVPFRYTRILDEPIRRADLLGHPVLRDLQVIRSAQGRNFEMTPEQWAALRNLLDHVSLGPKPRFWVEKTQVRGWAYRESGPYSLGQALVVPAKANSGADMYRSMREVQTDDIVLHLTDAHAITGVSRIARSFEEIATIPDTGVNTDRSYLVRLRDFRPIDPPLERETLFGPLGRDRLIAVANSATTPLFYGRNAEGLQLSRGSAYLTEAPVALIDALSAIYREATGHELVPAEWFRGYADSKVRPEKKAASTIDDLAAVTFFEHAEVQELIDLLHEKRQIVLEGPPGSGKTWVAGKLARYLTDNPLEGRPDERVETVQFHQSYGYEDFVQGIRPITNEEGALQYRVLPGIFTRLCNLAQLNPDKRFVLVIDEINRGNISRIFGELLFLLEYRNERVRLPYGTGDGREDDTYLTVPSNLYLIGTMNSTDRSLALIDYALRRRFYFYRLLPVVFGNAPVLERWLATQPLDPAKRTDLLRLFVALNQRIQDYLSPDFQVGHSYFMTRDIGTQAGLDRVWRHAVMPLLIEYFHNSRDQASVLDRFDRASLLARSDGADSDDAFLDDDE